MTQHGLQKGSDGTGRASGGAMQTGSGRGARGRICAFRNFHIQPPLRHSRRIVKHIPAVALARQIQNMNSAATGLQAHR